MTSALRVIPSWTLTLAQARNIIDNRAVFLRSLSLRTALGHCDTSEDDGFLLDVLDMLSLPSFLSLFGSMTTNYPVSCILYRLSQMEHVTCPVEFIKIAENELRFPAGKFLRVDV